MAQGRKPGSSTGRVEVVEFGGVKFRRYPDSKRASDRTYFTPGPADRERGVQRLHQEVWKAHHGRSIPPGHDVHHRDHDHNNNDPANLELVDSIDHQAHHDVTRGRDDAHMDVIRPLAAEWHRSEEGREWHSKHARDIGFGVAAPRPAACEQCGTEYTTRSPGGRERFCSNNCKTKHRKASGVDNEQRICEGCGGQFTVDRYSKSRNCSGRCAWVVRRRNG